MCVLSSGFLVFSFFIYLWLKFGLVQVSESKRIKESAASAADKAAPGDAIGEARVS